MSGRRVSGDGFCVGAVGVSFDLDASAHAALDGLLDGVFGTLPDGSGERALHYRVAVEDGRFSLWRDGELVYGTADPRSVVDCVELDVYDQWIEAVGSGLLLHAGAVVSERGAVLLAGPSGSGKSTLTLQLAVHGMPVLSDEWVMVHAAGRCSGICRPIALEGPVPALPHGWFRYDREVPTPDGAIAAWKLMHPPGELREHGSVDLCAVVLLDPSTSEAPSLEALDPAAALQGLSSAALRGGPSLLGLLGALVDRRCVYRLVSGSPIEAVGLLRAGLLSKAGLF